MTKKVTPEQANNRARFLDLLRCGDYPKGPFVKGQDKPPEGAVGYCAVGLPYTVLCGNQGPVTDLCKKLALTPKQLSRIQNEWNDSPLTFPEIADRIEHEFFEG
jgi:hypothetical protein